MPQFPQLQPAGVLSDDQAMSLAIAAGRSVAGTTYPNPPVGCVILDAAGNAVGIGATDPVGGSHAEPNALAMAGHRADGGTAVVTLEPCNHQGRTPPCTQALARAGVSRVIFAVSDPNPVAAGGADYLRYQGIEVKADFCRSLVADGYLRPWLFWQEFHRPHITLKTAGTLDGLAAATDLSSQWITGPAARARVHEDRSHRSALIVGTGTVLADNPRLTARKPDGTLYAHQPVRIVVGRRDVPTNALIRGGSEQGSKPPAEISELYRHLRTHDVDTVVDVAADMGLVDCLIEGGPRLAGQFLTAGLVDAIESYVAPALLGSGLSVLSTQSTTNIRDIVRFHTHRVELLGDDVLVQAFRRV